MVLNIAFSDLPEKKDRCWAYVQVLERCETIYIVGGWRWLADPDDLPNDILGIIGHETMHYALEKLNDWEAQSWFDPFIKNYLRGRGLRFMGFSQRNSLAPDGFPVDWLE